MGKRNIFIARGISAADHYFSLVDTYVYFRCSAEYDNPLFNVSGWKLVRAFYRGGGVNIIM